MKKLLTSKQWYPWLVVALLWVVALLNYMDRQMLSTMRASMAVDITALESTVNFGKIMAVFMWIYGFMSPVSGIVADRVNRKWLIVGSLAVWSTVTLLMGYAETYNQVYWLRAAMGISEALYIPAALSLIADYFTGKQLSLAIGIHMTGLYMGQAIGGFGAFVAAQLSWQQTFHWFGLVGIVYALILIAFLYEDESAPRNIKTESSEPFSFRKAFGSVGSSIGALLANGAFWTILFFFASCSIPGWSTKNWLPELFASSLGIDMVWAGPVATITIAASSFLGVMVGGPMADRWAQRNLKGRIFTSAIGMTLMIPALILMGFGSSLFSAISAGIIFGFGYGLFDSNTMPILCQFVNDRRRATAYGIMNMSGLFIGAMATNVLGSLAQDGQMGLGFVIMAGALVLAILLQLTVLKPKTLNME
ncbi:MAG: MFS transporter [Bacteroidales bacterium]|nr:MFS transporter [Bacteroidales bacterium]MBD5343151.1 MFS transporter [Bacteroides sp.]MBD5360775.1 MFS transporter [Bacteroides sp.]MBD5373830.1 MFS transporter [Bacteroides sp.]